MSAQKHTIVLLCVIGMMLIIIGQEVKKRKMCDNANRNTVISGQCHSLQWRHYERHSVSNHRRFVCLLNRLFRSRSKKISKLRDTGLWDVNSPVTGEFSSQRVSDAGNVSIWWRHHATVHISTHYIANILASEHSLWTVTPTHSFMGNWNWTKIAGTCWVKLKVIRQEQTRPR